MKADSISRLREIARRAVLARRRPMLLRGVACGTNPEPETDPEAAWGCGAVAWNSTASAFKGDTLYSRPAGRERARLG